MFQGGILFSLLRFFGYSQLFTASFTRPAGREEIREKFKDSALQLEMVEWHDEKNDLKFPGINKTFPHEKITTYIFSNYSNICLRK
jgi:hypothetical protein